MDKNKEVKKIFNWGEISRICSGTRSVVRKNYIPEIHKQAVNEMIEAVKTVLEKHEYLK